MKISDHSSNHFNTIDRDLIIVFVTGFVVAVSVVIMGIVILNQI